MCHVQGDGGLKGVCYVEVTLSVTKLHEIKAKTINFIFSVSVLVHLLMIFNIILYRCSNRFMNKFVYSGDTKLE